MSVRTWSGRLVGQDTPEDAYGYAGKNFQTFTLVSAIARTHPFSTDCADPEDHGSFLSCPVSTNNCGLDFGARFPQGIGKANEQTNIT